jgi:hypothetical protein
MTLGGAQAGTDWLVEDGGFAEIGIILDVTVNAEPWGHSKGIRRFGLDADAVLVEVVLRRYVPVQEELTVFRPGSERKSFLDRWKVTAAAVGER